MKTRDVIVPELRRLAGDDNVITELEDRTYYSQDLYRQGQVPIAVVRPGSCEMLARIVSCATRSGLAVFARGGGMSYTDAFLPTTAQSIVVDMTGMNRILEVNERDFYATVESGCTWAELDKALEAHGLRAIFWGPFSGHTATIGGSMSQGSVNFGSAKHGVSGAAALAFEIVLADGTILQTGSAGQPCHNSFFRHYGPDLTGLFAADAGALGIKTKITLALEKRPTFVDGISFAFGDFESVCQSVSAVTGDGLASEVFGMDADVMRQFMGESNVGQDLAALWNIMRASRNVFIGVAQAARIAVSGKAFLERAKFTAHFVAEGRSGTELKETLAQIRSAVGANGLEIPNTVPTVVRANPFPPLPVLHADGRRLLPLHGILPYSKAAGFHSNCSRLIESYKRRLDEHGVTVAVSFTGVGRNGFLYEPVFYWEDDLELFHERKTSPEMRANMKSFPDNPEARTLVGEIKDAIVALMFDHGAVHLQIGKVYPYLKERDQGATALLRALKSAVDPYNLVNPGALGLS